MLRGNESASQRDDCCKCVANSRAPLNVSKYLRVMFYVAIYNVTRIGIGTNFVCLSNIN